MKGIHLDTRVKKQMNMTEGPMLKNILIVALPLAMTGIVQQLFGSVDSATAGRYIGSDALAAIGGNVSFINLLINLFIGLSLGANILISRQIGAGNKEKAHDTVCAVCAVSLIAGVLLAVIGIVIAGPALKLIHTPEEIIGMARLYLRLYFCGMPFFMIFNFGSAIFRSTGDSVRPLICLGAAVVFKGLFNYLFVAVFGMGVAGVAVSTIVSYFLCACMIFFLLTHASDTVIRIKLRELRFTADVTGDVVRLGLPAGIQSAMFSLSNIYIQSAINSLGVHAIAGSAAAVNYEMYSYYGASSLGQTCVTFVSQNYGAGRPERCRRALFMCLFTGFVLCGAVSTVFYLNKAFFIGLFTTDPADMGFAFLRMLYVVLPLAFICTYEVPCGYLRGLRYSILPTVIVMIGTCLFRIVWVSSVFPRFRTFESLMWEFPLSWFASAVMVGIVCARVIRRQKRHSGQDVRS